MVVNHVGLRVSSLEKATKFYLSILAPLGYKESLSYEGVVTGLKANGTTDFWLHAAEGPASTGVHVAFTAESRNVVDDFHQAALKAGAKDNGAPGLRGDYGPGYYAAFVLDLDGNNIEVTTSAS